MQALTRTSSGPSSSSNHLRVDLGSGVLARAVPCKETTVILPIGLGFYLESSSCENENKSENEEALDLAAARVAALRDRAKRAASRASRARAEAEGYARAAALRR